MKKNTIYCDLRFDNLELFEMEKTLKHLEDDGWELYHEFINENLEIYNKHYRKEVEIIKNSENG